MRAPVSEIADQILQTGQGGALVKNVGLVPIFLDNNSSVNPLYGSWVLGPGASLEWDGSREMWAVCAAGLSSFVDVLYSATRVFDTSSQAVQLLNLTKAPAFPYASSFFMVGGFASLELSPTEVRTVGTGIPSPRSYFIDWYADTAHTEYVTTDECYFSDTDGVAAPQPNLLWVKVKGASFQLRIGAVAGPPALTSYAVSLVASSIAPARDTYKQDAGYFGVSGSTVSNSSANDLFWGIVNGGVIFGTPLSEYPPTIDGPQTINLRLPVADANGIQFFVADAVDQTILAGNEKITAVGDYPFSLNVPRRPLLIRVVQLVAGTSPALQISGVALGG